MINVWTLICLIKKIGNFLLKKFFTIFIFFYLFSTNAYAVNKLTRMYCAINPNAEKCVKIKYNKEAWNYCFKIYPLQGKDEDPFSERAEKRMKCQCEYMNSKGYNRDCSSITIDFTNIKVE